MATATARKKRSEGYQFKEIDLIRKAQIDPQWWLEDCCGFTLWEKQAQIINALIRHDRVAVPAAFGVGKTWLAARAAAWWLNTHYPAKVITTAPTGRQVKDLLWAEIKDTYHQSKLPLGGEVLTTDIRISPNWFATGFATNEEHIDKFTGYHSPNLLLIFDQACGIHKQIWTAGEGLLTSENCRWLALSNTTDVNSEMANICLPDRKSDFGNWEVIKITAHDSPNVKAGQNIFPGILAHDYIEKKRETWRPGDPLWEIYIEANFVESGAMTVLHASMFPELLETNQVEPDMDNITLGVDFGDEGTDPTVIFVAAGKRLLFIERVLGNNPAQVIPFVVHVWDKVVKLTGKKPIAIYTDAIGVGSGPTATLAQMGYPVIGVKSGVSANDNDTFINRRIEMAWEIRELAEQRALSLKPVFHTEPMMMEQLAEDLTIRFEATPAQKIKLEDKRRFRTRMRRSPDVWDAMVLAVGNNAYMPGISTIPGVYSGGSGRSQMDLMNKPYGNVDYADADEHRQIINKLFGIGEIDEEDFGEELYL